MYKHKWVTFGPQLGLHLGLTQELIVVYNTTNRILVSAIQH